jgi:catechol 2,3-dioxygenase
MATSLRFASIDLRVHHLDRSVDFYVRRLGFALARSNASEAELSTSPTAAPLLRLIATSRPPAPPESAGLFHAALLLSSRGALAGWLRAASANEVEFAGFSDHGVSEAVYLSDAEGNGLEFYVDRPRQDWPFVGGKLAMGTQPLDVRNLLSEPANQDDLLAGARWGHLHLRVTNLAHSVAHYRRTLGVEVTQDSYPGASFLAADGYHHHLGLNTWGSPRRPQPPGAPGLAVARFVRAGSTPEGASANDPDGIDVRLSSGEP